MASGFGWLCRNGWWDLKKSGPESPVSRVNHAREGVETSIFSVLNRFFTRDGLRAVLIPNVKSKYVWSWSFISPGLPFSTILQQFLLAESSKSAVLLKGWSELSSSAPVHCYMGWFRFILKSTNSTKKNHCLYRLFGILGKCKANIKNWEKLGEPCPVVNMSPCTLPYSNGQVRWGRELRQFLSTGRLISNSPRVKLLWVL